MAAEEGFEPSQTESESAVYHYTISASILKTAWIIIDIFRPFVKGFVCIFSGFSEILVVLIAAGWKACYNNKGKPVEKTDRQKGCKHHDSFVSRESARNFSGRLYCRDCQIIGDVVIGQDAYIGHNCVIRGDCRRIVWEAAPIYKTAVSFTAAMRRTW